MVLKSRGHVIYISLGPLHTFPSEIILALVVADRSEIEVMRFRRGDIQSAYA